MQVIETQAGALVKSKLLDSVPGVVHGFGVRGVDVSSYLDALDVRDRFLVATNQVHGNRVHRLDFDSSLPFVRGGSGRGRSSVLKGDAFISDRPGIVCFVRSADCVPILIADTKRPAVAAIHAGWRGTAADAAGQAVAAMSVAFGTDARDCVAAIGPRICGDCYAVGDDVVLALLSLGIDDEWRRGDCLVDLGRANAALLTRAGLEPKNISILPRCTSCDETFASWRRDKTPHERQFNFILLRK